MTRDARHVTLRGAWVTLPRFLGPFAINFAMGMTQAMARSRTLAFTADPVIAIISGCLAGLMSGRLTSRAIRIAVTAFA